MNGENEDDEIEKERATIAATVATDGKQRQQQRSVDNSEAVFPKDRRTLPKTLQNMVGTRK
jgi:hypothetical protein